MDAQDFRSLQEAYLEIYEERGTSDIVVKLKSPEERAKYLANLERREKRKEEPSFWDNLRKRREEGLPSQIDIKRVVATQNKKEREKRLKKQSEEKERRERAAALKNEQYDLYDIILSHLLDEGYAETPEAAEAIMVNMGEEWKEDIVEAETGRGPRLIDAYDKPPYSDDVKDAPKYKPIRRGPKRSGVVKK